MKIGDFRAYERELGTAELGALHGCKAHPSEAIANLSMSTRGFQLRWGRQGLLLKRGKRELLLIPSWSGVG